MLIRRERPADIDAIRAVHGAAFASAEHPERTPVEVGLTDALRTDPGAIFRLSLVAVDNERTDNERAPGEQTGREQVESEQTGREQANGHWPVVGHVICSRGVIDGAPALGLGPLGVLPDRQGQGIGSLLMHSVLAAADALDEPIVLLLGHLDYYPRFGFRPAREYGIEAPDSDWGDHFQARPLTGYRPTLRGRFTYAAPFDDL